MHAIVPRAFRVLVFARTVLLAVAFFSPPPARSLTSFEQLFAPSLPAVLNETLCMSVLESLDAKVECSDWLASKPKASQDAEHGVFPDCALVSTSASLLGKSLGARIDEHYPVIRINRVPTKPFYADFGQKTDVFFGNRYAGNTGRVTELSKPSDECLKPGNKLHADSPRCWENHYCLENMPGRKGNCPSLAVITELFPHRIWARSPVPVFAMKHDFHEAAKALRFHGGAPSAGYWAFMALLPACSKMTLYGFSGNDTADGHTVMYKHSYEQEHELYKLVGRGILNTSDFRDQATHPRKTTLRKRKWLLDMLNSKQVELVEG